MRTSGILSGHVVLASEVDDPASVFLNNDRDFLFVPHGFPAVRAFSSCDNVAVGCVAQRLGGRLVRLECGWLMEWKWQLLIHQCTLFLRSSRRNDERS